MTKTITLKHYTCCLHVYVYACVVLVKIFMKLDVNIVLGKIRNAALLTLWFLWIWLVDEGDKRPDLVAECHLFYIAAGMDLKASAVLRLCVCVCYSVTILSPSLCMCNGGSATIQWTNQPTNQPTTPSCWHSNTWCCARRDCRRRPPVSATYSS